MQSSINQNKAMGADTKASTNQIKPSATDKSMMGSPSTPGVCERAK